MNQPKLDETPKAGRWMQTPETEAAGEEANALSNKTIQLIRSIATERDRKTNTFRSVTSITDDPSAQQLNLPFIVKTPLEVLIEENNNPEDKIAKKQERQRQELLLSLPEEIHRLVTTKNPQQLDTRLKVITKILLETIEVSAERDQKKLGNRRTIRKLIEDIEWQIGDNKELKDELSKIKTNGIMHGPTGAVGGSLVALSFLFIASNISAALLIEFIGALIVFAGIIEEQTYAFRYKRKLREILEFIEYHPEAITDIEPFTQKDSPDDPPS